MIEFFSETDFILKKKDSIKTWIKEAIFSESHKEGDITFVFCDDEFLYNLNVEFLKHDTLTDIITFDYSLGKEIHGEIYISIERVRENALDFDVSFNEELKRVIIHGVLHLCGYSDKTESQKKEMRAKENTYLQSYVS